MLELASGHGSLLTPVKASNMTGGPQFNQSGQLSNSQDGCQTNSRRYDDLLFIHGINKIEDILDDFISVVL